MRLSMVAAAAALLLSLFVPASANAPPVIEIEPVMVGECGPNGKGTVVLDASGSYDPEGAPLTFSWSAPPNVDLSAPTSAVTEATSSKGNRLVTLTVSDGSSVSSEQVSLKIDDTIPPASSLHVIGQALANGWYHGDSRVYAVASDDCDDQPCASVKLTGTTVLVGQCGGVAIYGPGGWTAEHWGRDSSGNEGAREQAGDVIVVYDFRARIDVPIARTGQTHVEVHVTFDGTRPVPGAQVSGTVHRILQAPGTLDGVLRFPFNGTTDESGRYVFDVPLLGTFPGEYRARAQASALGFSHDTVEYYTVGAI